MISVYPFGDEYYTFAETAVIHRIDPKTLETTGKVVILMHVYSHCFIIHFMITVWWLHDYDRDRLWVILFVDLMIAGKRVRLRWNCEPYVSPSRNERWHRL